MSATVTPGLSHMALTMEIEIQAPVERVWAALTTDLAAWWPRDFHIGGEASTMSFDPVPGGLMKETWPGGGLVWGQVLNCVENQLLQSAGDLFADFGGPSRTQITYRLEATESGTILHFSDHTFGVIAETMADSKQQGWDYLLVQTLKPYCEQDR